MEMQGTGLWHLGTKGCGKTGPEVCRDMGDLGLWETRNRGMQGPGDTGWGGQRGHGDTG